MTDRISVVYDANIKDLKDKLDELIKKNKELATEAGAAQAKLSGLNSTVSATNNAFNQSTTVINNYNNSVNTTNNSINQMNNSMRQAQREVRLFEKGLQNIAGKVAAVFAINNVIQFGQSIVDVTRKTEILQNRLAFVFETGVGGQMAFERLYKTAQRLGLEFEPLIEGFSKFAIAAKTVGFSAAEAEDMFVKVSAGLRAAGASSLQTQRAFLALEQMLSKGVVSAEELRRQLGEALPGAANLMVRAYNKLHPGQEVTNQEFIKLMESGKIMSAEVLPELSRTIEDVFAPALAGKAGSLDAAINRVNTSFTDFKRSLGQMNLTEISNAFTELSLRIENIKNVIAAPPKFKTGINFIDNLFGMKAANALALTGEIMIQGLMGDVTGNAEAARQVLEKEFQVFLKKVADLGKTTARQISLGATESIEALTSDQLLDAMKSIEKQLGPFKTKLFPTKEENERMRVLQGTYSDLLTQFQSRSKFEAEQSDDSAQQAKDAITAAKELVALEETRLLKTTEGTAAYYAQLIKVIEARKDLVKLEKAETPKQMGLDIAKLDKDLNKAKQMINSFTPEMADIVEEGVYVPSLEAWERLSKDIKDLTKQQLEDRAATIETEIQLHKEGTDKRLELEKALVMAKANLAAKEAEIQGKSVKEIEAIFAKANIDIADLDKKFYDKKREEAEEYADFYKRLQDGLDGYEGRSLQRRIKAIREYYGKLKAEAFLHGRTKEEMDALDANRDKAILQENLKEVNKFVNAAAGIYGQFTQIQQMEYENQKVALDNKLAQGLISEEEYNRQVVEIEKKRFEQNKQTQKVEVLINTASAIARAFADLGPVGGAIAAFALGAMSIKQISLIDSAQFPQAFKDGVIDLKGPGTETSDSIPARLSRGESVMTAEETKRYKPVLQAIRDGEFEAFVAKKYTGAMAINREQGSFAQNITNSLDMNNAEVVDAIRRNKSVKIANWDDFSKIMSKPKTAHKVYRRRAW